MEVERKVSAPALEEFSLKEAMCKRRLHFMAGSATKLWANRGHLLWAGSVEVSQEKTTHGLGLKIEWQLAR